MFTPQQFTGHGPSSPGTPQVPPALPGSNPVILPTSSTSTVPPQHFSVAGRPPISLSTKQFQLAVEPHRIDVAVIANLPALPEISYDKHNADHESDALSDLGGAETKAPISVKQMEFSMKQLTNRMGQPNFSTFNKRKKL